MLRLNRLIAFAASTALIASSTAAVATAPVTSAPGAQAQTPNAWMMLSVLSPTRSVAIGAAAAAAQRTDVPPPPPEAGTVAGFNGEFLPVILWWGLIAIALTIKGSSAHVAPPVPNSAT